MAKRTRSLGDYEWDLLESPTKRRATSMSQEEAEEDGEGVSIDERRPTPQQHGLSVLNSLSIKGVPKGRNAGGAAAATEEEIPSVYLDEHWQNLYNGYMNKRFQDIEPSVASDDEQEQEHDRDQRMGGINSASGSDMSLDEDLFASLGRSSSPSLSTNNTLAKKSSNNTGPYDCSAWTECFLCGYGDNQHDGIKAKHVQVLFGIMRNYGLRDNMVLAQHLHLYFKNKVYREDSSMPMLTKEIALAHIEGLHSLSASIFLGESIRKWKRVCFSFENIIFKANGKYDDRAFVNFEKAQKMLNMLYKMKIDDMPFNPNQSQEDLNRLLGAPMIIIPELKERQDHDKRSKKTKQLLNTKKTFNRGFNM